MRHGHGGYMHLLVEACRASISSLTCSVKAVLIRDAFAAACQGTHSARPQLAVT